MKYTQEDLTEDQAKALRLYADLKGRYWKQALRKDWATGKDSALLRQIRNNFGPSWLNKFKFT